MLWAYAVALLAFALAFLPVLFGWSDIAPPGVAEAILVLAAAGGVVAWAKKRTRKRAVAAGILVVAAGFHLAWFFGISVYGEPEKAPALGAKAPEIRGVRVKDKATFALAAQRGRSVLLVFFRGPW